MPPRKVAAEEETCVGKPENLGEDFSQNEDQAENLGMDSKFQRMYSENNDLEEVDHNPISNVVTDKHDFTPTVVDMAVSNLQLIPDTTQAEQVNGLHGLQGQHGLKQRSTWTRIMRMDYKLGRISKALEGPILGKRVKELNSNLSLSHTEEEVQKAKREKLISNDTDVSARVDDHPCQEQ